MTGPDEVTLVAYAGVLVGLAVGLELELGWLAGLQLERAMASPHSISNWGPRGIRTRVPKYLPPVVLLPKIDVTQERRAHCSNALRFSTGE